MNKTLKEIFYPTSKREAIVIGIMFMAISGFLVFEGVAFVEIMDNPDEGVWYSSREMATGWYVKLSNSELFTVVTELSNEVIFVIELQHLENLNITIEFDAVNCIVNRMIVMQGAISISHGYTYFNLETQEVLNVTTTLDLNLRDMNYPSDFDALFIRATSMASNDVELLYRYV